MEKLMTQTTLWAITWNKAILIIISSWEINRKMFKHRVEISLTLKNKRIMSRARHFRIRIKSKSIMFNQNNRKMISLPTTLILK